MNIRVKRVFFVLMVTIGFIVGMVVGYVQVGLSIEAKCKTVISSYKTYIANTCSGGVTAEGLANLNLTRGFKVGV